MKKGKRLLILLAVVVLFGVGAYLLNLNTKQQEAAKDAAKESAKTVLVNASADTAAKLAFTHGDETVQLAKKDGQWVYEPRESFELNTSKVEDMLTDLKNVESVRTVSDTNDANKDYGLDAPAVVITVTADDGTAQKISIGDKNATTGNYYAAVEGKQGVYTVSADLFNAFDVTLMQLLTDEAFPTIAEDAVTGVDWADNTESKTLVYKENGDASAYSSDFHWFAQQADGTLATLNDDAVSALLSAATGITYEGVAADTKDDLATYELDHPVLTVTLHYTEQVPQSQAEAAKAAEAAAAATAIPTIKPAPAATATPATMATVTATSAATATSTSAATATAAPTATAKATAASTAASAATPAVTAAPTATAKATATVAVTPAVTAAPTGNLSGHMNAAIAEDASAVPSESPTATATATPEPTVAVERAITIWVGGTDASGNYYLTTSKTNRIFTVKSDAVQSLQKLTVEDLLENKPLRLTVSDLTGMTATLNGVTKTITSTTESVTGQNGEATTQVVYQVDGKPLKTTLFSLFVNQLKAIKAENTTETPVSEGTAPILSVTFTQNRAGFESVTAAYYPYDENFDQAVVNGNATMLVNKRDVTDLQSYFDQLVGTEATPTPDPAATAAPAAQ